MKKERDIEELISLIKGRVNASIERLCQNPEAIVIPEYIIDYHVRIAVKLHPEYSEEIRKGMAGFY